MRRTGIAVFIVGLILGLAGWRFIEHRQAAAEERALARKFTAALQSNRKAEAIELGLRLVETAPTVPEYAYNLACAFAKDGRPEDGNTWLKSAGERGFIFLATMQRDEDLAALRETSGYIEALTIVKANSDRELEAFKREAANDEPIIVLPPKHDPEKASPLIVALHGSGGKAADFVPAWRDAAASAGAILVVPQGRLKFGDGWRWGKVEHGEWQVLHAIAQAKAKHMIDAERVIVTGFSEGGSVSFVVALRNPQAVTGAIPMCGEYVRQVSPVLPPTPGMHTPRLYIITGELDPSLESNRAATADLEGAGYAVRMREFTNMGHSFPPEHVKEQAAALEWVMDEPGT